jgi:hypothetical protein
MKALSKTIWISVLVLFGALASGSAMAGPYGHGHGGWDRAHRHGGNIRFGISLGVPLFGPRYYPAPYYAYPAYRHPSVVVVEPAAPPVYIERGAGEALPAPSQAQGDWYYCAESRAYYPYVTQCPAGWQRVPAQPPAN